MYFCTRKFTVLLLTMVMNIFGFSAGTVLIHAEDAEAQTDIQDFQLDSKEMNTEEVTENIYSVNWYDDYEIDTDSEEGVMIVKARKNVVDTPVSVTITSPVTYKGKSYRVKLGEELFRIGYEKTQYYSSIDLEGNILFPKNSALLFSGQSKLLSLTMNGVDTSNVTTMAMMFWNCTSLADLDLSMFDTSKVTSMSWMFSMQMPGAANFPENHLVHINMSNFDTSSCTDMSGMFTGCTQLKELDLSMFDTSKVTDMGAFGHDGFDYTLGMFQGCESLETLDLSNFDTSSTVNMSRMFYGCTNLKSLNISSFNTSNVTGMERMFGCCESLEKLNLSSFNTNSVTQMNGMFEGSDNLSVIRLGDLFTVWRDEAYLPAGTWKNNPNDQALSETELYSQYPANAAEWAGTWYKGDSYIEETGISLNKENETIKAGDTVKLTAAVEPDDATIKDVTWTSSDTSVATVDYSGNIIGITAGYAVISAVTSNGIKADCTVRVLFTDVANSSQYFYEPVYWAVDKGITVGHGGAGKFSATVACTREQIVTFLWRLMGEPEPKTSSNFTDVAKDAWYYKSITWAAENKITVGLNDGTGRFGVGQPCTREQCVTFLYRTAGKPPVGTHEDFTDVTSDRYFYDAISWASSKKITVGLNDGTGRFGVGQTCTRAMIVTFLYRFANQ